MSDLPAPETPMSVDDIVAHYEHIDVPLQFAKDGEAPKHTKADFAVAVVDAFIEQFPDEREAIGIVVDPRVPANFVVFRARKRLILSPIFDLQKFGDRIEAILAERAAKKASDEADQEKGPDAA